MPTLPFQALLRRTVRLCGLDFDQIDQRLADVFAQWLESRVRKAWHITQWPGTITLEEHAFRPLFSLAATYPLGAEVYDAESAAYYTAIEDGFAGQPVTDASYWEETTDLVRTLAQEETGASVIAEILGAWRQDPRRFSGARPLGWTLLDGVALFPPDSPATFWLAYRRVPPLLSATPWDSAAAYVAGDVVYYAAGNQPGESYLALRAGTNHTPTDATYWAAQRCPEVLADYAARACFADWLREDGQTSKADSQEAHAERWLLDRLADLAIHQQQTARYSAA